MSTDHSLSSSSSSNYEAASDDEVIEAEVARVALLRQSALSVQPYQKTETDEYDSENDAASTAALSTSEFLDIPLQECPANANSAIVPRSVLLEDYENVPDSVTQEQNNSDYASKSLEERLKIDESTLDYPWGIEIIEEGFSRFERDKGKRSKGSKKRKKSKDEKKKRRSKDSKRSSGASNIQSTKGSDETRRAAVFKSVFRESVLTRNVGRVPVPRHSDDIYFSSELSDSFRKSLEMVPRELRGSSESDGRDDFDENDDDPNNDSPPSQLSPVEWNSSFNKMPTTTGMDNWNNDMSYNRLQTSDGAKCMQETSKNKTYYRLGKIKEIFHLRRKVDPDTKNVHQHTINLAPRGDSSKNENIVWADQSITDRQVEDMYFIDKFDDEIYNDSENIYQGVVHFATDNSRRRGWVHYCIIVSVIGMALAITSSVIFVMRKGVDDNGKVSSPLQSFPSPLPPDESNETSTELKQIDLIFILEDLELITSKITLDEAVFDDPNSPQSKSKQWCIHDMETYDSGSAGQVAQRYILANLFYATDGDKWENATGWLDNSHECFWHGIVCDIIGGIETVTDIDLGGNGLGGTIPLELGHLSSLSVLDLSFNALSGGIFTTISMLNRLESVSLNDNLLSGELNIPDEMKDFDYLEAFRIEHNELVGTMPPFICDLSLDVLIADCKNSSPPVDCSCCTECF
ncbi:hypothetical protein ACHAXS_009396 [Conticribra weissflogii]